MNVMSLRASCRGDIQADHPQFKHRALGSMQLREHVR
jgi:hypothetical protein